MIYMYIICIFFKITPKNHTCTYGIKESLDFHLVLKTDVRYTGINLQYIYTIF